MVRKKPKEKDAFEVLGEVLTPPAAPKPSVKNDTWMPELTPAGLELFHANEKYILCWSEKGSGKTYAVLDKLVRHLYDNENGFAVIGVRTRSMANKGGAWDKLINEILPRWKSGLGLEYSDVRKDSQHNEYVWVENAFGGWSPVYLISCPNASQLTQRMPGFEASFIFWDELTQTDSEEYFKAPSIQIGRRHRVTSSQQYIAACNPAGPSHWVYKKWFEEAFNEKTQAWDPDFRQIYFPKEGNRFLKEGYVESLRKIYKNDPVGMARMVTGQWVEKPSGEALFADLFIPLVHVVKCDADGNPVPDERAMPRWDTPIVIGLDPGSVFNAFIFMQWVPVGQARKWLYFDEAVTIRKRVNYRDFVPVVMRKVKFWREVCAEASGRSVDQVNMPQIWISDNSAFNQYRAANGTVDALELERYYEQNRAKYNLEQIRIKECPKPAGSVISRVQLMQTALSQDEIIVSSGCPRMIAMLRGLEGDKGKEGEPMDVQKLMTPKRSDHVHTFDGATYPMLMATLRPTALIPGKAFDRAA